MAQLPNPRYSYSTLTAQELIDQAFMYIGVLPADQDVKKARIALNALNEILYKWINKGVLQYNEITVPVKLQNGVAAYDLPSNIYDIYDVTVCSVGRRRTGTAISSSGVAANAFDDNILTTCAQNAINGYLGMQFTDIILPVVNYVGILSGTDTEYTLVIEGSDDGTTYIPLLTNKRTEVFSGLPTISGIVWYSITTPRPYKFLRIRETQGATLNIRELYFESLASSIYITSIGRSEYMQFSQKMNPGRPSLYCMYKNNTNITLNLYGVPTDIPPNQDYVENIPFYNFLICRGVTVTQSINFLRNPLDINPKFLGALRSELTAQLSLIYMPEKAQILKGEALDAFKSALANDNDGGALKFQLNSYRAR